MDKKRKLLMTLLVVLAVFIVNRYTGEIFNGIKNTYVAEFLSEFKCAAVAFLGAVILKKTWIYRRFDTALLKKSWTTGLFEVFFTLVSLFIFFTVYGQRITVTAKPTEILLFLLMMFCIGIYEETLFRGLLQNGFHEFFGEDTVGHVILAVVCAGLCFGALHLTNALRPGVSLSNAAIQALSACGGGIFTSAAEAAAKTGGKVIGVDSDQSPIINAYGENMTVTSALKSLRSTVYAVLDSIIIDNTWDQHVGKIENLGLVSGTDASLNFVGPPEDSTQWNEKFTLEEYHHLLERICNGEIAISDDLEKMPEVSVNLNVRQGTIK